MSLTSRLYRLLVTCTLITFLMPSGRMALGSESNPQWLSAYQQIIHSNAGDDVVLLMESFLYTYQEDEGACEAMAVPYLLQVGTQIVPHIEALGHEGSNPVVQGLTLFAYTLKKEKRLLYERASLNSARQLWETLKYIWLQQDQQALLFEQALEQMNVLRKQQPDSLSLIWFTAELHRLKPGGGHWQAERIWENWVTANPDRNTARTNIYRKTPYTRTGPSTTTEEWSFPVLKGAVAFAERPVRITAGGGGSVYLPAQQRAQHRHGFHKFASNARTPHHEQHSLVGTQAQETLAVA